MIRNPIKCIFIVFQDFIGHEIVMHIGYDHFAVHVSVDLPTYWATAVKNTMTIQYSGLKYVHNILSQWYNVWIACFPFPGLSSHMWQLIKLDRYLCLHNIPEGISHPMVIKVKSGKSTSSIYGIQMNYIPFSQSQMYLQSIPW